MGGARGRSHPFRGSAGPQDLPTLDTDIVYRRTADNVERLVAALRELEAIYRDPAGRRIEPDATRFAAGGHHLLVTRLGPLDVLATIGANRAYEDLERYAARYTLEGMSILLLDLRVIIETKEQAEPSQSSTAPLAQAGAALRRLVHFRPTFEPP